MKQEDLDFLLKDLCARLLYGVKCEVFDSKTPYTLSGILPNAYEELYFTQLDFKESDGYVRIKFCKPYLFPLSSMTDEQKKFFKYKPMDLDKYGDISAKDDFFGNSQYTDLDMYLEVQDWLNANHFDYRGLIEKSLALDATGLGIYDNK